MKLETKSKKAWFFGGKGSGGDGYAGLLRKEGGGKRREEGSGSVKREK